MKPEELIRHKNKGEDMGQYIAYVEAKLSKLSIVTLKKYCVECGTNIDNLSFVLAAKKNDLEVADVQDLFAEAQKAGGE